MRNLKINNKLKNKFIEWLGDEGIDFFKNVLKNHGTLIAVWMEKGIPHPVHFREGMQVRNWMRNQPEFKDKIKNDHWLDNNWEEFVKECLIEGKRKNEAF